MAKASIEINDEFTFVWYKVTAGHTAQKRNIPEFVRHFFEKNVTARAELLVEARINLRDNYEVKKVFIYDDKGYYLPEQPMETIDDKVMGKPEDETNLCFMLEMTPNVFSLVNDEEPSHVNHARFSDKNIHMKCKYLSF